MEDFVEKETSASTFTQKKIAEHILDQENVKIENVKKDTGRFADTLTPMKDASEETPANTSTQKEEKEIMIIMMKPMKI